VFGIAHPSGVAVFRVGLSSESVDSYSINAAASAGHCSRRPATCCAGTPSHSVADDRSRQPRRRLEGDRRQFARQSDLPRRAL